MLRKILLFLLLKEISLRQYAIISIAWKCCIAWKVSLTLIYVYSCVLCFSFSKLNYADTVFGACLLARIRGLIQPLQNACARYCFPVLRWAHATSFLNNANLSKLETCRQLHFAVLLFGIIKTKQPSFLYDKLRFFSVYFRHISRLLCLRHRTARFLNSFCYAASKCWNNLPPPIQNASSLSSFKKILKAHLLNVQQSPA